jgi:hypothetical protein
MIMPFLSNGVEVFFYDVTFEKNRFQADIGDVSSGDVGLVISISDSG